MATHLEYTSEAGEKLAGALATPSGTRKVGGVVVVQEWWGLNEHIASLCDRFAEAGFAALAPDLYHGKLPKTKEEAAQMMAALDMKRAIAEIGAALAKVKSDPRCNGRVGVVGFCLGGALAFAAASSIEGLAAVVPFYGIPQLPMPAYAKIKAPVQAHFAKNDDWAKPSVADEIQGQVRAAGGHMELFLYDAGHAFMRSTDPEVFHPENARVAWTRAIAFLGSHLAS
jgi:carboxymethylenebutenolidase